MIVSYGGKGYLFTPQSVEEVKAITKIIEGLKVVNALDSRILKRSEIESFRRHRREFYKYTPKDRNISTSGC